MCNILNPIPGNVSIIWVKYDRCSHSSYEHKLLNYILPNCTSTNHICLKDVNCYSCKSNRLEVTSFEVHILLPFIKINYLNVLLEVPISVIVVTQTPIQVMYVRNYCLYCQLETDETNLSRWNIFVKLLQLNNVCSSLYVICVFTYLTPIFFEISKYQLYTGLLTSKQKRNYEIDVPSLKVVIEQLGVPN